MHLIIFSIFDLKTSSSLNLQGEMTGFFNDQMDFIKYYSAIDKILVLNENIYMYWWHKGSSV